MVVNSEGALNTINSLLIKIDDISKKEYDEKSTIKEFSEIVFDVLRFVRLSVKGLRERSWYPEYCEFIYWPPDGLPTYSEFWDHSKKITIGIAYEEHINELKNILYDCKKDFEMIQHIGKKKQFDKKTNSKVIEILEKIEKNTGESNQNLIIISKILKNQPDLIEEKLKILLKDNSINKNQKSEIEKLLNKYNKITTIAQKTEFWIKHIRTLVKFTPFILNLIS